MKSLKIILSSFLFFIEQTEGADQVSVEQQLNMTTLSLAKQNATIDEQLAMTTLELIKFQGYPCEEHVSETEDDYLLSIQRITGGKDGSKPKVALPVVVLHGLGSDAGVFLDHGDGSLAFMLADAGFDVWLGNFRGTLNSKHKTYSRDSWSFWDYGYDELGKYDVPSIWNYVLNATRAKQLYNVALSMGVTSSMAALASLPEYNEKVKGYVGMGPVTRLYYTTDNRLRNAGIVSDFLLNNIPSYFIAKPTFDKPPEEPDRCYSTPCQANDYRLAKHKSSGVSLKVLVQYAQSVNSKYLSYFDYGFRNTLIYHSLSPPHYNLSKITLPVALFTAIKDSLADPLDVALLLRDLPNVYTHHVVPNFDFDHDNFLDDPQVPELVYTKIIDTLLQWNSANQ